MDQWIRTDKKMEIVERVAENGVPYLYFPALEGIGVMLFRQRKAVSAQVSMRA